MNTQIIDFFPQYPSLNDSDPLDPYFNFNQSLYLKKEFYDNRLERVEAFPERQGQLMKHQKAVNRYLSTYTPYDGLLLMHYVGTGKSCSAFSVTEKIKSEDSTITGTIILGRGKGILNNLKRELVFTCTDGRYIPEDYDNMTKETQRSRINKEIEGFYQFGTFDIFSKKIEKLNDDFIKRAYSNKIIILDEVHNLRIKKGKKETGRIYTQIHRMFHLITNFKIMLMSGTPMKDSPTEIATVLNLVLPLSQQLPVSDKFAKEYLTLEKNDTYSVKDEKKSELKALMKGRVSYLKEMSSNVQVHYHGEKGIGNLTHFIVDVDKMQAFQGDVYKQAINLDLSIDKDNGKKVEQGVYSRSRQAILFVFPDGSYGSSSEKDLAKGNKKGFDKYITKTKKPGTEKTFSYSLSREFKKILIGKNVNDTLNNIAKYSSKYASTIHSILESNDQNVFVYNELVVGSGAILLGLLLELFGFKRGNGSEQEPGLRYSVLTNQTATVNEQTRIIHRFNQNDNMQGKFIKVIIGSRVIGEGITLKNVQNIQILTPHWNYSEIIQALARGIRLGSHRALEMAGITPVVGVYQRVSLFPDTISLDLYKYEKSEKKDISIKHIERLIMESAYDCALNYERNHINGIDGSRECEYTTCNYKCDDIDMELVGEQIGNNRLDYSTYQLYYSLDDISDIIELIKDFYKDKFSLHLETIISNLETYSGFQIMSTLNIMINENYIITDKYGFSSYLREENNIYFLVSNLSIITNYNSLFYTEYPTVLAGKEYSSIVNDMYIEELPNLINRMINAESDDIFNMIMKTIPIPIQEEFIEGSIVAEDRGIEQNREIRRKILDYFKKYIVKVDDVIVSTLLYEDQERLRCLSDDVWTNCKEDFIDNVEATRKRELSKFIEQNKHGYYGVYDNSTGKFCIRDLSDKKSGKKDARRKTTGLVCNSYSVPKLAEIAVKVGLTYPDNFCEGKSKDEVYNLVNKKLRGENVFENKSKWTRDDLCRALYWSKDRSRICDGLEKWFIDNNLVVEGDCGKRGKKKV